MTRSRAVVGRVAVSIALSSGCLGCVHGGGPYIGYGTKRGVIVGGEVAAGVLAGQVALGVQNQDFLSYLRLDATGNSASNKREGETGFGGRLGAGYGWGRTHKGGVFAIGGNVGYTYVRARCEDYGTVFHGGVEMRYVGGEVQFVAVSRVERMNEYCLD